MSHNYSNIVTDEETTGLSRDGKTITFPWPVKQLTITNDSRRISLSWKFKTGHDWATLKPGETVSIRCSVRYLQLSGEDAVYRVWGIG